MSRRDIRALAVGLIVVVLWLALRVTPTLRAHLRGIQEDIAERGELLVRARNETGKLGSLADSITALEGIAKALPRLLLIGEDSETATFDLTRRVAMQVAPEVAFVRDISAVPDTAASGELKRTTVRASLETDITGLMVLVRAFDADSLMAVERLAVAADSPTAAPDAMEHLQVALDISAWFRSVASRPDSSSTGAG